MADGQRSYEYTGDRIIRDAATIVFAVVIAILGAAMMTLTSSPLVKGAAFLWLPAALQLIAGVWLGPVRGALAGGIGAQAAGVIAYGGWALPDFIMNLIAGGLANSFLPGLLFRWFKLDPTLGVQNARIGRAFLLILLATFVAIGFALVQIPITSALGWSNGAWTYFLPTVAIVLVLLVGRGLPIHFGDLFPALIIVVLISFLSAAIGVTGAVVGGQTWQAAIIGTGIGWFLGDTASCILGLYTLAQFTPSAQKRGIAPILR